MYFTLKNIRVKEKPAVLSDTVVQQSSKEVEELIAGKGRALLRPSGTEPVIRVMIESESEEKCMEYAQKVADSIIERGHCIE